MLVIKHGGRRKEVAAERDFYKTLIMEVQVIQHWCYSSYPTAPALVRPISASIRWCP